MRHLVLRSSIPKLTSFARTTTKRGWLIGLFVVASWFAGATTAVNAQSALDGFDPNANAQVRVVVVQPDGKILLGGDFTTLAPNGVGLVTRNHIARLNPDGTVDTAFDPNASNNVWSITVQPNGKILVGGEFASFSPNGGAAVTRSRMARLNPNGTVDPNFDPNANGTVRSMVVQADGKVLAAGDFETITGSISIGGQARSFLARLDATTGLADPFDPNANGSVISIALQTDGKIIAAGGFTSIAGVTRNYIARLDPATGLADSFNPNANFFVNSIAVQADGKILAGGLFINIGGQPRNRIARLDATSGLADSFNPSANNAVQTIAIQADGKILTGGYFNGASSIGGANRNYIARLDATTGVADSYDPKASNFVNSIAVQPDGKAVAGGDFTTITPNGGASVTRNHIARLEADGRLDQTLNIGMVGNFVDALAVQPDGKILIGGLFSSVLGVARSNIARLNADGTLDMAFNPIANSTVESIAVQEDGKILVGGIFAGPNSIGGQTRNHIARLDATSGLADSFDPNANNAVFAIAVQADGKIIVGGQFNGATSIGGQTRNYVARLNPATGLADSFNPNPNGGVYTIAVQADGKILVGGDFFGANSIGGQMRNFIARLDATGLPDSFNPNATNQVLTIAVQADGKVLAGGNFHGAGSMSGLTRNYIARLDATSGLADAFDPNATGLVQSIAVQADGKIIVSGIFTGANSIGGQTRNRIARLDPASGLADSFDPNSNDFVHAVAIQADGKILAGGFFSSLGGQSRNLFARLTNDTGALQNLTATQTTVTWACGGANSQFTRVVFEYSTNNVNYTPLGNGTPAGSNWTLTGLNLFFGQNFYIRARGHYRSGYLNGSESIEESVRVFYLRRPAPFDFDGDGKTDTSVFRPPIGFWYMQQSTAGFRAVQFGSSEDKIVPGDFDNDGKCDTAVWRPNNGYWYILNSSDNSFRALPFGQNGDKPAPGDYDADGKTDIAVFRPSNGTFYVLYSSNNSFQFQQWGQLGDLPVMGDYDGDNKTDFAVFRPSIGTFYILYSSNGAVIGQQFGTNGDKPIAGDFDGDGKTDIAVFRPSTGGWYYLQSSNNAFRGVAWGASGDIASAGDYDGDGKWEVAVFRPSSGTFYILPSTTNALRAVQFGISVDVPVPSAFVP